MDCRELSEVFNFERLTSSLIHKTVTVKEERFNCSCEYIELFNKLAVWVAITGFLLICILVYIIMYVILIVTL